jgi:cyclic beta-1,2-glucan synthetase
MSTPSLAIDPTCGELFPELSGPQAVGQRLGACSRALEEHVRGLGPASESSHPADRWLQDNLSFLRMQIRATQRSLGPDNMQELLRAGKSSSGNEPRIYRIAAGAVAQASAAFTTEDLPALQETLRQYPSLQLCELWAFSSMLRLALLEQLCSAMDSETVVSCCVKSLRLFDTLAWREFVDSVSSVEAALRRDPAGIYADMDFETRDQYRHEIETLAKRSRRTELAVAEAAIRRSSDAASASGIEEIQAHCGYHLIGPGAADFAKSLGCKFSLRSAAGRLIQRWPGLLYGSCFIVLTAAIAYAFDRFTGPLPWWMLGLLLIPASQIALEIVNSAVCHWVKPRPLPSMDFSCGIPDSCQTMVVVPSLLLSPHVATRLVDSLEIRYLANRDPNLLFALVTDFPDADQRETPADSVLEICIEGIHRLNERYAIYGLRPFYLFHRARQWNPKESKWMGYERKRGKLNSLNKLLLGQEDSFEVVIGDETRFSEIRYVITLDADTQLLRDTAAKLIAAMAHPLNRPVLDPVKRTVVEGYALIRPRVSVSMESAGRSLFSQIFSGMAGFDPYATAVSDVYHDLFGLTSFTGKGIYDLRAFDAAVGDRFPEDAILSHDLIEGEHVRTAFLPSAELVEDYPATYQAFAKRKHRWVRGDWQLLPWLLWPPKPPLQASVVRNPLGLLSRWKLFDNLRRSLAEITLLALLAAGWIFLHHSLRWTLAVLALLVLPCYADILLSAVQSLWQRAWSSIGQGAPARLLQGHRDALLHVVFLPHQACLMVDAVARTLYRRYVTHRNLLEWQTMAQSESGAAGLGIVEISLYLSSAAALLYLLNLKSTNVAECLVLELWVLAPLISWFLNRPMHRSSSLSDTDRTFLRKSALGTWRYFADNNEAAQHWLIPDNVQLDPPIAANRISPTNLGLQLTANLAAHDFGYLTASELSRSLRRIFDSMAEMPRYRGHFYNWYDTQTLQPLVPRYVSSVDSGNLAASLCTLRQGLLGLQKQPLFGPHTIAGLRDHVLRLRDELPSSFKSVSLMRIVAAVLRQLESEPTDLFFWEAVLDETSGLVARLEECLSHACARRDGWLSDSQREEISYWKGLLAARTGALVTELYALAPWLAPEFESELRLNVRDTSLTALMAELSSVPVLAELPRQYERIRERLIERLADSAPLYPALRETLERLLERLSNTSAALEINQDIHRICAQSSRYFEEMDFIFLCHPGRNQLRIGYNVTADKPDESCYDLLASEARAAVFLAIAKGQVPREAWFKLGRGLTVYRNHRTLVSWSGTMFEYLMPVLNFKTHEDTLLGRAVRNAVRIQQIYARERNVPWGISEAGHSGRDTHMQYQYRAFGVPALSMQSDLPHALVIAPYASMLALSVDPVQAAANLRRLAALGCWSRHGFFESLDYSAGLESPVLVRSHMAHHQGMGLMALDNALLGGQMQERFHLDPRVQSTEFLLEERMSALAELVHTEAAAA